MTYRLIEPTLSMAEALALAEASTRWQEHAAARGTTVLALLRETEVSEEEARAWFEEHADIFGSRPFEQVRSSVVKMARLEKLRASLSAEDDPT